MLKLSQELKLVQKLDVRMIQSLKLLPLTTMQLEQRINQELELNPMLQLEEPEESMEEQQEYTETPQVREMDGKVRTSSMEEESRDFTEADWIKYIEDGYDYSYEEKGEYDPNLEEMESLDTYNRTLPEHLYEQLGMTVRTEEDREIGEFIIGSINEDGYLELTIEEMAQDLVVSETRVKEILKMIQQFDPPGVGARDLRECLLLQLKDRGLKKTVAWLIIHTRFNDFVNRKFKEITKALSIGDEEFRAAMDVISTLTPRPGSVFHDTAHLRVIPDIIIEKVDEDYVIILCDGNTPHLTINSGYRKLLMKGSQTPADTRKYLVDRLNSARWFINSLEQRRTTILKVTGAIVEMQREFLDKGRGHLKPMTLMDVADRIGMAISTVQRVTSGKYVQTPQGILELKAFFTQRIASSDGTDDLSSNTVKEKMKELVREENASSPLSDQKIADILNGQGITISRRAIAKYRDELGIPTARLRKTF